MSTKEKRKIGITLTRLSPEDLGNALDIVFPYAFAIVSALKVLFLGTHEQLPSKSPILRLL
ncbi:unnamed protein product [Prunus armeniaca]